MKLAVDVKVKDLMGFVGATQKAAFTKSGHISFRPYPGRKYPFIKRMFF